MNTMAHFIAQNAHLLWWIIGLSCVGLLLMGCVIFLTNRAFKKAALKKDPEKKEPQKEVKPPIATRTPPPGGWLSEYLTMKGFFRVGELSVGFLRAIRFLRSRTPGALPLYQLPWYLLIGPAGAGKSTMIRESNLQLPLGEPHFGILGIPKIQWWFLNKGVLLDIRGNFFINSKDTNANENGWRTVLGLLARYRPKRPIDGIILTIPATEFLGKNAIEREELIERAKFMAQKLHASQHSLGLQLPLYLIISKSDTIPGFKSFCQEIPSENNGNILGWSNPYSLDTAFNTVWIEQAFNFMNQFLGKLRLEIFQTKEALTTRDGLFVFPGQLDRIKDGLTIYLNHLFKENTYSEGLFLRGIYFVGDGMNHNVVENLSASHLHEDQTESSQKSAAERRIFFVDDLIQRKIFYETGLAQPVKRRIARANRHLRVAKASTIALAAVGTFGVLQTYQKLKSQNDDLLPVLSKINTVLCQLKDVRGSESAQTVALFDNYARQLIQMMHTLSESQFTSIFFPPSWFSPVQDNLHYSVKVSYNHIILRTIYIDLLLKGRELLYLRPTNRDRSSILAQIVNPLDSMEFGLLQSYITRMVEFTRMVSLFNNLSHSNDISPLRELVQYTFHTELPASFEEEFYHFRRILRDVPFPPIDLNPYAPLAQDTLRSIYHHFLNGIMSTNDPLSLVGRINTFLWNFGRTQIQNGKIPSLQELRNVATSLEQAIPKLNATGKTWIDGDYFDLGPEFVSIIGLINDTSFLGGKTMVEQLAAQTALTFQNFKAEMLRLLPILSADTPIHFSGTPQIHPSMVLSNLYKNLSSLFQESFMAVPPSNTLVTVVPENKITYWDPQLIDMADQILKDFEGFKGKGLLSLPVSLRESILLMAQQNMQLNLLGTIAKSQSFVEAPRAYSLGIAGEEIIRSKIMNVKDVAPKFVALLEVLNRGNVGESFVALRNLLGTLSLRLLEHVERAAMENIPYAIKGNTFEWWDGQPGAIFTAYNVYDKDDLQRYLLLQRERIYHWAFDYARYMVEFLSSNIMKEAQFSRSLVDRWKRIMDQLLMVDQRKPDNSVNHLETDLLKLNDLDLSKCFQDLKLSDMRESSGDFFLAVKRMVRREMRARCEVLQRTKNVENYTKLAEFFNDRLKNKFPFVGSNLGASQGEAEPEDIRTFFNMYKEFGDKPTVILDQVAELGSSATPSLEFLKTMDDVKNFFAEFLESKANNDTPALDFSIEFRTNKNQEQLANYIVDWTFKSSDENSLSNHQKDLSGRWSFGNLVELGFRWPANAGVAPALDEKQKYMNVNEQTASFTFSGRWSLLWLLRTYGQAKPTQTEPTPYTLRFVIPLGPDKKTVAYNQLTLRAPSKGKAPGRVMEVPLFPTQAPPLPQNIVELREAVLTRGLLRPATLSNSESQRTAQEQKTNIAAENKPSPTGAAQPLPAPGNQASPEKDPTTPQDLPVPDATENTPPDTPAVEGPPNTQAAA